MSARNRIPTAIEPLLRLPPEASLTILTGTLGCSQSWLTSRFVGSLLGRNVGATTGIDSDERICKIMLVSWMRDLAFWKNEVRRTMGLDISKAIEHNQLAFIDCLYLPLGNSQSKTISIIEKSLTDGITELSTGDQSNILLILDSPDILLATASATAEEVNALLLRLRQTALSVILTLSADQPLLQPATQMGGVRSTPLETECSRFLTQQAHNARLVVSVRALATGAARDVSGVIRATKSSCAYDENEEGSESMVEEMEALYLVHRDGTVKVSQRGADAV